MNEYTFEYTDMFSRTQYMSIDAGDEKNALRILKSRIGRGKVSPMVWSNMVNITEVKR